MLKFTYEGTFFVGECCLVGALFPFCSFEDVRAFAQGFLQNRHLVVVWEKFFYSAFEGDPPLLLGSAGVLLLVEFNAEARKVLSKTAFLFPEKLGF